MEVSVLEVYFYYYSIISFTERIDDICDIVILIYILKNFKKNLPTITGNCEKFTNNHRQLKIQIISRSNTTIWDIQHLKLSYFENFLLTKPSQIKII